MGANVFYNIGKGKTAKEAFDTVVENALWNHGHGGYTGTIAEKHGYTEFKRPKGMREATVRKLLDELPDYHPAVGIKELAKLAKKYPKIPTYTLTNMVKVFDDKWGPAVCMEIKPRTYVFSGWASS